MAVVAANIPLGARHRTQGVDGHGTPTAGTLGPLEGPWPGRIVSRPAVDGDLETGPGVWELAVDEATWPLAAGDEIVEPGGRAWTVVKAEHYPSDFDASISYVSVEGVLVED
ncbi:hypothetical protein [Streptosporangium sp. NPDC002524]|uniref:hypothetical protein n=1 Tax=Streptosporangium sp. NPDC002524 TaxID=3154537 RepID=UPI00332A3BD5